MDWSATAAYTALAAAIISPIVTTYMNNKFQLRMKDREVYDIRRIKVIENYIKSASESSYELGVGEKFAEYNTLILLYAPEHLHGKIQELNRRIEGTKFDQETRDLLYMIATELKKIK